MLGGSPIINIFYLPVLHFCLCLPVSWTRWLRGWGFPAPLRALSLQLHCECLLLRGNSKISAARREGCPLPALLLHLPDGLSASSASAHTLCSFCHLCEQMGGVRVEGGILQRLKGKKKTQELKGFYKQWKSDWPEAGSNSPCSE